MSLTYHAAVRRQQRAIPAFIIEVLETCGSERRCNGAEKCKFACNSAPLRGSFRVQYRPL
jgi:hypothetical protein